MPKLKPEEIAERRREIVEAARRCFIRSGFHQTTTDEICHEANITPGGLYHYFSGKDELIKAVVQAASENAVQTMREAASESPDPRTALRRVGELFLRAFYEPDAASATRLDLEIWSEGLRNEDLLGIIHRSRAATRDSVAGVIQEAIARGDYSDSVDPVALANLFVAIYTGLRLGRLLGPNDVEPESVLEALRMMVRGELVARREGGAARRNS